MKRKITCEGGTAEQSAKRDCQLGQRTHPLGHPGLDVSAAPCLGDTSNPGHSPQRGNRFGIGVAAEVQRRQSWPWLTQL